MVLGCFFLLDTFLPKVEGYKNEASIKSAQERERSVFGKCAAGDQAGAIGLTGWSLVRCYPCIWAVCIQSPVWLSSGIHKKWLKFAYKEGAPYLCLNLFTEQLWRGQHSVQVKPPHVAEVCLF